MYNREELLVKIASLFYESNKTQTQIAKELGISRPTIAAMLTEAREKEIVQIIISHPNELTAEKEKFLHKLFPCTQILVAPPSNGSPKESVGLIGAKLLKNLFPTVNSVGVGWGTTLAEVVKAFTTTETGEISFVPLIGGMINSDAQYHSNHLVSTLASKLKNKAKAEYLYAPALADNIEIKQYFEDNNLVKEIMEKAKNVDLAIIGIGNPIINSNYQEHGHITQKEITELKNKNAIGDILTSFFTSEGKVIDSNISRRMIGLSINDLEQIDTVIAVASGKEKAQSVLVTLESKLIDYLVIDDALANALVNLSSEDESE